MRTFIDVDLSLFICLSCGNTEFIDLSIMISILVLTSSNEFHSRRKLKYKLRKGVARLDAPLCINIALVNTHLS